MIGKYATWIIEENFAKRVINKTLIEIPLTNSNSEFAFKEGILGKIPQKIDLVISGICLWDARWQVHFKPKNKANPGAKRSIALPSERKDAFERIKNGQEIEKIFIPLNPGVYHLKLLRWQVEKLKELNPRKIVYHVPIEEYHIYIRQLEELVKYPLDILHLALEDFYKKILKMIEKFTKELNISNFEILSGICQDPEESFLFPYLYPEKFGSEKSFTLGVEDFVELRLSIEAQKITKRLIPVIGVILEIPHPYMNKSTDSTINIKIK